MRRTCFMSKRWESAREGDCTRALAQFPPFRRDESPTTARSGRAFLNGLLIAATAGAVLRRCANHLRLGVMPRTSELTECQPRLDLKRYEMSWNRLFIPFVHAEAGTQSSRPLDSRIARRKTRVNALTRGNERRLVQWRCKPEFIALQLLLVVLPCNLDLGG